MAAPSLSDLPAKLHDSERAKLLALRQEVRQIKMERDILAKAGASLPTKVIRRSRHLHADRRNSQAELPVATMCSALQVSKSGCYDWHESALSMRAQANAALLDQIKAAHVVSDETYGMPRIRAELAGAGICASRKRIAALMRANGIAGVSRRLGYVVTTRLNSKDRPAPDPVRREFAATDINQLWVPDMT